MFMVRRKTRTGPARPLVRALLGEDGVTTRFVRNCTLTEFVGRRDSSIRQ
jgi:hypothetical protein